MWNTVQNSTFWPGLGESDTFYSWAVSIFPIGEVLMSLVAAYLSTAIPYLYTIPLTCCIAAVGGLVYALASHGMMVIVARFLFGTTNGLSLVLTQAYIGRENKKKRGPTVEKMLLFYSITMSSSLIAATGVCTIILLQLYAFHHTYYSFLPSIVSILSPHPYLSLSLFRDFCTNTSIPKCQSIPVGRVVHICCGSHILCCIFDCILQNKVSETKLWWYMLTLKTKSNTYQD